MQHTREQPPGGWRSGDFVVDPQRRRLLRGGIPVCVEERTFDLIALLAAHHDRAVDRREVTRALWGPRPISDTTLRQVVHKARRALDDDGRRQAVIRTLHGRSLRWVAPIQALAMPIGHERNPPVVALAQTEPRAPVIPGGIRARRDRLAVRLAVVALTLVAIAAGTLLPASSSQSGAERRVAIAPIENATGETTLDWTRTGLPGLLASLLEDAGIDVVDPHAAAQGWNPDDRAARERLRAATGAAIVVDGHLRKLARTRYELDLRVYGARDDATPIRIDGALPGELAADAVASLRLVLEPSERNGHDRRSHSAQKSALATAP